MNLNKFIVKLCQMMKVEYFSYRNIQKLLDGQTMDQNFKFLIKNCLFKLFMESISNQPIINLF